MWCILTDTWEADITDRTNAASRPLTVCTYPEVKTTYNNNIRHNKHVFITFSAKTYLPLPPQVFVLSGVIAMVTCAVFLRLNSLLKLAVLLLAVAVYSYLIHLAFLTLTRHDMLHK